MSSSAGLPSQPDDDVVPRRLDPDPPGLPDVITFGEALDAGLTRGQIQHRVEIGMWQRLAYGIYRRAAATTGPTDGKFARERRDHVARAVVALRRYPKAVLGLESATIWHEMPLRSSGLEPVTLLVPPDHPRGSRALVRFHVSDVPRGHRAMHPSGDTTGRLRVTSPERTWVDLARMRNLGAALMAGDATLRAGRMTLDAAAQVLAECGRSRGASKASRALEHLSPVRESPLESDSWAYFVRHRLPLPEMQVDLVDDHGRFLGRADYWWKDARLVGECDGRAKYVNPSVLYDEKRREDAIRAAGNDVIRWGAPDLHDDRLALRIRAVLRDARRR